MEMSVGEEKRLLASLDKGMAQLKNGQGVPIEEVRKMVPKWARGDASQHSTYGF
jgi:predicted transcriptional regulator